MIISDGLAPPLLELTFYLGPDDHRIAVAILLSALVGRGAEVGSDVFALEEGNIVRLPMAGGVDTLPDSVNEGIGFACKLSGFPGLVASGETLECEEERVLARTEAGPLSIPFATRREQYAAGLQAYDAFICMAKNIDARYGAICIEYSLETPAELRNDPRSLAFHNFWIGQVPAGTHRRIERIMQGAYSEEHAGGVYYSTDPAYNPERIGIDSSLAEDCSIQVARILGRSLIA